MSRLFAMGVVAAVAAACDPSGEIDNPPVPVAGLRYVNLVSDTGALNFRVVDIVAYAPNTINAAFRTGGSPQGLASAFLPPHLPVEAGNRRIKVFNYSTDPAVAQDELLDTTYTFSANTNYTVYLQGFARTGSTPAIQAVITTDDPAPATAGTFALRLLNLAPTLDLYATTPVDFFVAPRGPAALVGPAVHANQAFGALSAYVNVPVGTYKGAATATGTTAPVLFQANTPPGTVGTSTLNPIAGTLVEGTAITAVIVPRSVPGSPAPSPAGLAVTSITAVGDTATVTTAASHGLAVNDVVTVDGANETAYNGSFAVRSAPTGTTFTYVTNGTPSATPATGTPVYRRAENDFTRPYVLYMIDRHPPRTAP